MPCFSCQTLKLMSSPTLQPDNLRYVNTCASCIFANSVTDLISTITDSSTIKSSRYPQSNFTSLYSTGTPFCHSTLSPLCSSTHKSNTLHRLLPIAQDPMPYAPRWPLPGSVVSTHHEAWWYNRSLRDRQFQT